MPYTDTVGHSLAAGLEPGVDIPLKGNRKALKAEMFKDIVVNAAMPFGNLNTKRSSDPSQVALTKQVTLTAPDLLVQTVRAAVVTFDAEKPGSRKKTRVDPFPTSSPLNWKVNSSSHDSPATTCPLKDKPESTTPAGSTERRATGTVMGQELERTRILNRPSSAYTPDKGIKKPSEEGMMRLTFLVEEFKYTSSVSLTSDHAPLLGDPNTVTAVEGAPTRLNPGRCTTKVLRPGASENCSMNWSGDDAFGQGSVNCNRLSINAPTTGDLSMDTETTGAVFDRILMRNL
jgi:hypothetical protein